MTPPGYSWHHPPARRSPLGQQLDGHAIDASRPPSRVDALYHHAERVIHDVYEPPPRRAVLRLVKVRAEPGRAALRPGHSA